MNAGSDVGPTSASDAVVAADGSPVLVYRRLPPTGEPEIIHAAIPTRASILELGAGAGRVTHPLVALGHVVTAIDASPEMLAQIRGARTILADIVGLDLHERFDVVVLGSHLLNDRSCAVFLATARRHVAADGAILAEVYPQDMDWNAAIGRPTEIGPVTITVTRAVVDGADLDAEVAYAVDGRSWTQPFGARLRDEDDLRLELGTAGFTFDRWLDASRGWLLARPAETPSPIPG